MLQGDPWELTKSMSLSLGPKSIIGAQDMWQNFTESGTFGQIPVKLRKRNIDVLVGLVRKFAEISKKCKNT